MEISEHNAADYISFDELQVFIERALQKVGVPAADAAAGFRGVRRMQ